MEEKKKVAKKSSTAKKKTTNRISKKSERVIKEKTEKLIDSDTKREVKTNGKVEEKVKSATTFNLVEVIIIMIITAIFGILIGSSVSYFKDNVIDNSTTTDTFKEFIDVYNEISEEYYDDNLNKDGMIEAGIKGMVDYLNDGYSSYLDYDSSISLKDELEGEFIGMGATITIDDNNNMYIVEIIKDSPAEKAGFLAGDIIIRVGDTPVDNMTTTEVSYLIKGEEGTKVDITILREGQEKVITLVRGKVIMSSVSYHVTEENEKVGYIDISVFAKNTTEQFKKAMDDLVSKGVESVIIDVRDNSGGYLSTAKDIASLFLQKGSVVYQLDTKGSIEKIKSEKDKIYDTNVVVITNGGSASASEILASSLNENLGSELVGEKTFGKGTVQKTKELSSGAMIKYTIQEWYTPNGNKVDGRGITPTQEVSLSKEYYENQTLANDDQYQKAIEILKK